MQKIRDFTEAELQFFRDKCNFTAEELEVFNLKSKDESITYIANKLCMSESKVSKLIRRVKNKMIKVL